MLHCEPHWPAAHNCPLPHCVPSAMFVHDEVLVLGWQVWQGLFGAWSLA